MRTRRISTTLLLLVALAPGRPAGGGEPTGVPLAPLVWDAADARADDADAALAALLAHPDADWESVHGVLRAGREYAPDPAPPRTIEDPVAFDEFFRTFPWELGKVRAYPLGDGAPYFYTYRLPPDYDGTSPVPVLVNLGLGRFEGPPPLGFAAVELNPLLPSRLRLGRAPLSMTAGSAGQSVVLSVIADLERRFRVDRDRVFLGGYSRFGNATWYLGLHRPGVFAGILPASGYYDVDERLLGNLEHVAVLALAGSDRFHRAANEKTAELARKLERAGHPDITLRVADGKAVSPEDVRFLWTWMAERRRDPLPGKVSFTLLDPRDRGASWIAIDEVRRTGGRREVRILGGDESFAVNRRPARVTAENLGENRIRLHAENVERLTLRLSPRAFDLTEPVRIEIDSKTVTRTAEPSVVTLLENFRRDRDVRRLFPAVLSIRP